MEPSQPPIIPPTTLRTKHQTKHSIPRRIHINPINNHNDNPQRTNINTHHTTKTNDTTSPITDP
jgi:hypothetical protein